MEIKLEIQKYKQHGDISWVYKPLKNIKKEGKIEDFRINNKALNLNLENPIDIECQPSYDGTVNLILNDDVNPPRIINTRWSRLENNTYKIVNREQINQSNIYDENLIDRETRLFRNTDGVTKIDLYDVSYSGKLKAGNYIFYMKYMDDDYNETDIVAQSGTVSIFNGTLSSPSTISGGLMDEETDKSIILRFSDLDTSFTYLKLYVYRVSCDSNGIKLDYAYKINTDYEIKNNTELIYITGFEEYVDISVEELNIKYNIVDSVKSQAQVQNMLFFANVSKSKEVDYELQEMSLYIGSSQIKGDDIGYIDPFTYRNMTNNNIQQVEYYSPINIYYNLGYWPDEIYRFGIVYIYNDDRTSPVYNLRGVDFHYVDRDVDDNDNINYEISWEYKENSKNNLLSQDWIGTNDRANTKGVFKFDNTNKVIGDKSVNPIGIRFNIPNEMVKHLHNKGIKGFFFVRQSRIPTVLCQGYSVGVDRVGYYPMIYDNNEGKYIVESFKNESGILTTSITDRLIKTDNIQSSGLISVDTQLNKQLQSMFDTSEFKIEKYYNCELKTDETRRRYYSSKMHIENNAQSINNLLWIDEEVPQKIHQDKGFSTKAGMQEDLRHSAFFDKKDSYNKDAKLVRGIFTGFIGTTGKLADNCIYNIRIKNYDTSFIKEYFEVRMNDKSPFYPVSQRYCISPKPFQSDYELFKDLYKSEHVNSGGVQIDVFRGDCFTNTVTTRLHRNFTSSSVPINDTIIDPYTWKDNFKGVRETTDWNKINKADVDAVPIGTWITYKCLSNYNLSLRSVDPFQIDEKALMGNDRSFFPLQSISVKSSNKIPESNLINGGYSSMLGVKRNFAIDIRPYINDIYDTRIMFSNIQVDGAYKNSYKVFQGLSYEDIDRQYGSITKILPWGVNLFCVFEHGLAIIPVNEKALLQTTEGSNIHMYGANVLQKQVVLISDTVGSIWKDSVIRTPMGIYGVDTETHKIWKYSDAKKLEIISDFSMQRYLHDNIDLKEQEKYTVLGKRNVKTHYNAFKGDVMFTYYNNDKFWNICYNEPLKKWITRYSWTPLISENIDHAMFSFDLMRTNIFGIINTNLGRGKKEGLVTVADPYNGVIYDENIIKLNIPQPYTGYTINKYVINGYYYNNNKFECDILEEVNEFNNDEITIKSHNNKYIYFIVDINYTPKIKIENDELAEISNEVNGLSKNYKVGFIKAENDKYSEYLNSNIYVHGRSITADEINYFDNNLENQCLPTKWYDSQHPFEFEVVINEPKGQHKIFDNLVIISNNVEPKSLEVEIIGDVYNFDKKEIYKNYSDVFPVISVNDKKAYTKIKWDSVENNYSLLTHQDTVNIKDYGRRLGNIYYNEDKWYFTFKPIYYRDLVNESLKSTRIRDKYAKIRVKYSGEKLAVIVALQSLFTLSYV